MTIIFAPAALPSPVTSPSGSEDLTACTGEHRYSVNLVDGTLLYAGSSWGSAVSALASARGGSIAAEHAPGEVCAPEAQTVVKQAAIAAAAAGRHPAFDANPEIARVQAAQRYIDRVCLAQETAGLVVPASGFPGFEEWRGRALQACLCAGGGLSAGCPVHASLVEWLAVSA